MPVVLEYRVKTSIDSALKGINMPVELSIVMPCLNESETLEICIRKAQLYLDRTGISAEIVIGDNGSTDGSQDIARRLGARLIEVPTRGYGAALFGAIKNANGKYCIMADSDDSYDFSDLDHFVNELRKGTDLVMGNRFRGGIKPGAMPWKNRYIGNPLLTGIGLLLFKCPAHDFHCGLRGFSMEAFARMDLRTTGMEFASEMVIKATLKKMNIVEVPTTLRPDGRSRPPHLRPYRDGWRHLRFMLLFSPNWLFLFPGLVLMSTGGIIGGMLLTGPIYLSEIRLGIHTLIYCAAAIEIGFQAILFSTLSRAYATQEGLLPTNRISRFERLFTLERGILLGFTLNVIGLWLLYRAFSIWQTAHFGPLVVDEISGLVIISSLSISLGFTLILSSFYLSTIRLGVRQTHL